MTKDSSPRDRSASLDHGNTAALATGGGDCPHTDPRPFYSECPLTDAAPSEGGTHPGMQLEVIQGHESAGAAGNGAGGIYTRRESLAQSVTALSGRPGVSRMRHMLYEATHTALVAELQGRV